MTAGNAPTDYSKKRAIIETTMGTMTAKFCPDKAPLHVENFVKLAEAGYYNGTVFHRVIENFMIQGGDPLGTGMGGHSWKGPGTTVKAEFNDVKHDKGVLSMARSGDPNSAGSQFFICAAPNAKIHFLDGKYSAFGVLESGYEVADAISKVKKDPRDRPLEPVTMKSVKIVDGK